MPRQSPFVIELSDEERQRLESLVRRRTAEQRMVLRACIVLAAAGGEENASIAARLGVALNTVIKWRKRFFGGPMLLASDTRSFARRRLPHSLTTATIQECPLRADSDRPESSLVCHL